MHNACDNQIFALQFRKYIKPTIFSINSVSSEQVKKILVESRKNRKTQNVPKGRSCCNYGHQFLFSTRSGTLRL